MFYSTKGAMSKAKAQAGFIQNLILPGLILLSLVVAGIVLLAGNAGPDARNDQALMDGSVIIAQGVKLQGALERAVGDGVITRATSGDIDLAATLMASSIMPAAGFPVPPSAALTQASVWHYAQTVYQAKDAQAAAGDLGSSAQDDVMFLPHLSPGVCAAINFRLFGSTTLIPAGGYVPGGGFVTGADIQGANLVVPAIRQVGMQEGCVSLDGSSSDFVYYKVTGIR